MFTATEMKLALLKSLWPDTATSEVCSLAQTKESIQFKASPQGYHLCSGCQMWYPRPNETLLIRECELRFCKTCLYNCARLFFST